MPKTIKKETIHVGGIGIAVYTSDFENDFLSSDKIVLKASSIASFDAYIFPFSFLIVCLTENS